MEPASIGEHGVIGDGRSAALVSRRGTVDWLCWPRFDSPAMFAALLDPAGGAWALAPTERARPSQRYLEGTNVLETRFTTGAGSARLLDWMPALDEAEKREVPCAEREILRLVEGLSGHVELELAYAPRPDYARAPVRLRDGGRLGIRLEHRNAVLVLRGEVPLTCDGSRARARFVVRAGERVAFSLLQAGEAPAVLPPLGERVRDSLVRTARWWRRWAGRIRYEGPYAREVVRSALVLKLLCHAPSGALVAAATTSLPERMGGELNWDYRFAWLRDAALTADALLRLGFREEAEAFVSWLLHATRLTRPELRVLYDVYGEVPADEEVLPHLAGHGGSRPVRIRNAAAAQRQLDVYGEVIDATACLVREGFSLDNETRRMLRGFGAFVCAHWDEPDHGIWERRGPPREYTHSRATCWLALTRLLELEARGAFGRIRLPAAEFGSAAEHLRRDIEARCWSSALGTYVQAARGRELDASALLLGAYGFHPPDHPRLRSTARVLGAGLRAGPGLLYRYEQSRGDGEGAFGICSFWEADLLARGAGEFAAARSCFEAVLPHANELGLFAEEIDPRSGAALGNFPQAFTHVGLIVAALSLEERRQRLFARERRETERAADEAAMAPGESRA